MESYLLTFISNREITTKFHGVIKINSFQIKQFEVAEGQIDVSYERELPFKLPVVYKGNHLLSIIYYTINTSTYYLFSPIISNPFSSIIISPFNLLLLSIGDVDGREIRGISQDTTTESSNFRLERAMEDIIELRQRRMEEERLKREER